MKKNILMRTNILVCLVIIIGFTTTAVLSYQANYTASVQNIEQVSALTSEGIYYQLTSIFTKPVNISLTMANDSLLKGFLADEKTQLDNQVYIETIREYLDAYRAKYQYDSVFWFRQQPIGIITSTDWTVYLNRETRKTTGTLEC